MPGSLAPWLSWRASAATFRAKASVMSTATLARRNRCHEPEHRGTVYGSLEALLQQLGVARTGCGCRGRPYVDRAASPAARWSGWLAKMMFQLRSGDGAITRSGRNCRDHSRGGRDEAQGWASRRPSRDSPRKVTSLTPTVAAAASCSSRLTFAISEARLGEVAPTRIPIGHDAVAHVNALVAKRGHRCCGPEVDIVGMRANDQCPLEQLVVLRPQPRWADDRKRHDCAPIHVEMRSLRERSRGARDPTRRGRPVEGR